MRSGVDMEAYRSPCSISPNLIEEKYEEMNINPGKVSMTTQRKPEIQKCMTNEGGHRSKAEQL